MSEVSERSTFGSLLLRHRKARRLTQESLAERAHISVVSVSALERGVRRAPHRENVRLLAEALGLSESELQIFQEAANRSRGRARTGLSEQSPAHNLPWRPTSFIGRAKETTDISRLIKQNRMVSVTGSGGIGKTRTSLETAEGLLEHWADGTWFAELTTVVDDAGLAAKIASALGVRLPSPSDYLAGVIAAIKARHLLLILDSCEHLLSEVRATAAAILHDCPQVRILATSRERLRMAGEVVYQLPVLPVPASQLTLTAIDGRSYAAVALFAARASAVEQRFELNDESVGAVADICRRLDGVPLAIELAAGRLPTLGLSILRARLNEHFRVLTSDRTDTPARQQTLLAMILWSFDQLDEHERMLFRRVAVFVDGWTLAAAEAVCADQSLPEPLVLEVLSSLVDKSLVLIDFQSETPRYRLLSATREFAREQLFAAAEADQMADQHLTYFCRLFERTGADYTRTYQQAIVTALEADLADARSALHWAVKCGRAEAGAELLAATPLWQLLGLFDEEASSASMLLAIVPEDDASLTARLRIRLANALTNQGQTELAFRAAQRAVADARRAEQPAILGLALARYGFHAARWRRFDIAETALQEAAAALDQAEKAGLGTLAYRASLWESLGRFSMLQGDLAGAARAYGRMRTLCRALGNRIPELIITVELAEIDHARGETARAIDLVRETLQQGESQNRREQHATLLAMLAAFLAAEGDAAGAKQAAREAILLLKKTNLHVWIAIVIEHLALALALDSEPERAARLAGYSDARIREASCQREYTEQTTNEHLTALLGKHYLQAELEELLAEGAALTSDEAIAHAFAS